MSNWDRRNSSGGYGGRGPPPDRRDPRHDRHYDRDRDDRGDRRGSYGGRGPPPQGGGGGGQWNQPPPGHRHHSHPHHGGGGYPGGRGGPGGNSNTGPPGGSGPPQQGGQSAPGTPGMGQPPGMRGNGSQSMFSPSVRSSLSGNAGSYTGTPGQQGSAPPFASPALSTLSTPLNVPGTSLSQDPLGTPGGGSGSLLSRPSLGGSVPTATLADPVLPSPSLTVPTTPALGSASASLMSPTKSARKGWGKGLAKRKRKPDETPTAGGASASDKGTAATSAPPADADATSTSKGDATAAASATEEPGAVKKEDETEPGEIPAPPAPAADAVKEEGSATSLVKPEPKAAADPMDTTTDGDKAAETVAPAAEVKKEEAVKEEEAKPDPLPEDIRALVGGTDTPSGHEILAAINTLESAVTKAEGELQELEACKAALLAPADASGGKRGVSRPHSRRKHQRPLLCHKADIVSMLKENRARAEESHEKIQDEVLLKAFKSHDHEKRYLKPADYEVYHKNLARFRAMRPHIREEIRVFVDEDRSRGRRLGEEWRSLRRSWQEKYDSERLTQELNAENNLRSSKRGAMDELLEPHLGDPDDQEIHWDEVATVPDMLAPRERDRRVYLNTNGTVTDPVVVDRERKHVNPWKPEEMHIFRQRFLNSPKIFHKIAAGIKNKSISDCVLYYYTSKKQENYKKLLRMRAYKGRGWVNARLNGTIPRELANLGHTTTQSLATTIDDSMRTSRTDPSAASSVPPSTQDTSAKSGANKEEEGERSRWTERERTIFLENIAKIGRDWDKLAQLVGTKTRVQCKNFYQNHKRRMKEAKANEKGGEGKSSSKPGKDKDKGSSKDKPKRQISYWTAEEKEVFLSGHRKHGSNWKKLGELIPTKTINQIKNYYQNYKKKLGLVKEGGSKGKGKSVAQPQKGSGKGSGRANATSSSESSLSDDSGNAKKQPARRRVKIDESSSSGDDDAIIPRPKAKSDAQESTTTPMDTS